MEQTLSVEFVIFAVIGGYLFYMTVAALLLRASRKVRYELIDLGSELIERSDLDEVHRSGIDLLLDALFSWRYMAGITFNLAKSAFRLGNFNLTDADRKFLSDKQVERFFSLHMKVVMMANPIWAVILFGVMGFVKTILIFRVGLVVFNVLLLATILKSGTHSRHVQWQSE